MTKWKNYKIIRCISNFAGYTSSAPNNNMLSARFIGLFSFYNTMLTGTATTTFSANSLRPLRLPNSHQQTLLPKVVDFGNFGMLSAAQPRDSTPRDRMCRRRNLPLESSRCCRRRMSSCGADQILGMRCLQEAILETHQN